MSAPTAQLLAHPYFEAVRVAAGEYVFIGHLARRWRTLPAITKVEQYRVTASGMELFERYASDELLEDLVPSMISAAMRARLQAELALSAASYQKREVLAARLAHWKARTA